jgi:hypothetical protein
MAMVIQQVTAFVEAATLPSVVRVQLSTREHEMTPRMQP